MNGVLLAILFLFLPASSVADDLFDIKPVADGVYAAIAKPAYKVNCNAAIIFLDDVVLVVDTHSKPSAARALIEQIKKLTPKPVKFVVNTHFHWDHYQGNEAYPSSWPAGVEIISSEATRTSIEQRGIPRVKHEIVTMPAEIEQLRADLQKASTPEQRASIQKDISEAEGYLAELKSMQITLPTMTFDRSLILHRKSRTVEILWLGRAHTDDDVFAGHGDVMRDKQKFELWKQYFRDLLEQTAAAYADGATLDQAKKRVSDYLISKYADRFDPNFPKSVGSNVVKAYQVTAFAP